MRQDSRQGNFTFLRTVQEDREGGKTAPCSFEADDWELRIGPPK